LDGHGNRPFQLVATVAMTIKKPMAQFIDFAENHSPSGENVLRVVGE
jgi:hypothetical protein